MSAWQLTQPEMLAYVATLPQELQTIYHAAYQYAKEAADTLEDDFQIAAGVLYVFERQAKQHRD